MSGFALAAFLAACSRAPVSHSVVAARASATAVVAPRATGAPKAVSAPSASAPRATPAPPAPSGAIRATNTPVPAASPSPVAAIYSVHATPAVVHGGQSVRWDVRTTPDVVSVDAHVAAITLPMTRVSAGHFGLTFAVPNGVPGFFHGTYNLDVRALTASGLTLHRAIVLTFV